MVKREFFVDTNDEFIVSREVSFLDEEFRSQWKPM